jgi:hypothetical protein
MSTLLASKSQGHPFICGVLIAPAAVEFPLVGSGAFQPFIDTGFVGQNVTPVYNSAGKVTFTERGFLYTQTLTIRFPNGFAQKATRIEEIQKGNDFAIAVTKGKHFIIGRNDSKQNNAPKIKTTSSESMPEMKIKSSSMFAAGYLQLTGETAFPVVISVIS